MVEIQKQFGTHYKFSISHNVHCGRDQSFKIESEYWWQNIGDRKLLNTYSQFIICKPLKKIPMGMKFTFAKNRFSRRRCK